MSRIEEGQFGGQGDRPKGVLGAVQQQWDIVCGKARGMGVTEQWAARALVRGLLKTQGGTEEDGRMVLIQKDPSEYDERVGLIEQDVGGLKMIIADLRALISAQDVMLQAVIKSAAAVEALEKTVSELGTARAADAKKLEDFVQPQSVRIDVSPLSVSSPATPTPPTQNRKRAQQPAAGPSPTTESDKW